MLVLQTPVPSPAPSVPSPPTVPTPPAPPLPSANLDPNYQHAFHHGISLLQGWFPLTVEIVALVALVAAIGWRSGRRRLIWLPVSLLLAVAGAIAAWAYFDYAGLASDPAPKLLWVTVGATVAAVAITVLGWPSAGWWRRGVSVLAIPLALLSAGVVLNQWVGYYPTLQAALSAVTAGPLPEQTDLDELAGLRNTNVTTGKVVPIDVPDDASGFKHRTEYVYLPPTWFRGSTPPALSVIMMIGGEFNTPADWIRSGQIMPEVNKFAAANATMPILVFVDSGGSFNNDTECVNGPRGNSADHLTEDVPPYLEKTFGTSTDPARWAVAGWSMGGTCAVDLTVMHPDLFRTFLDIAGDIGPTSGNKQQTIDRLYGGDAATWAQFDPMTVMQKHGRYTGVAGLFDDLTPSTRHSGGQWRPKRQVDAPDGMGGRDQHMMGSGEVGAARKLCTQGKAVGIDCTVYTTTGGHTWQFAAGAFTSSLPWLAARTSPPAAPTS